MEVGVNCIEKSFKLKKCVLMMSYDVIYAVNHFLRKFSLSFSRSWAVSMCHTICFMLLFLILKWCMYCRGYAVSKEVEL